MHSPDKSNIDAPSTDQGAKPHEGSLEDLKTYSSSLREYVKRRRELREYRRRNQKTSDDPEVIKFSATLNNELRTSHNHLKDGGKKIGKGEHDIIVDILRQEGTLSAEFGLPEFCLLTIDDVFFGNAGGEQFVPRDGKIPHRKLGNITTMTGATEDTRFFTKDDVLIVFEVVLYEGKGHYDEWITYAPDNYSRANRMRALAKKLGTRTLAFDNADPEYAFHAHTISLAGVVVKKKDLHEVAALIRDNPKLYRLGNEFYSEEEIKKDKKQYCDSLDTTYEAMSRYGNSEHIVQEFLARIRQVYGTDAFVTAKDAYQNWLVKRESLGD